MQTIDFKITCLANLRDWSYDGSSTDQVVMKISEVILKLVAYFTDIFRQSYNVKGICESWN
jgi:hypothetical protein